MTKVVSKLASQKVVAVGVVFGSVVLIRLINRGLDGILHFGTLWFGIGLLAGLLMICLDRLVYAYFTDPEDEYSRQIRARVESRKLTDIIKIIREDTKQNRHLATNNVLFLAVWVVLALFLITSSLNSFAKGLILGLGISVSLDLYRDFMQPQQLIDRLFWPISRPVAEKEMKTVVYMFWGTVVLLCLLVV